MNGVIRNVSGMGKNFKVCRYTFLFIYLKVTNKKKCARSIYYTLLKIYRPQETMTLNLHLVKLQIFVRILRYVKHPYSFPYFKNHLSRL